MTLKVDQRHSSVGHAVITFCYSVCSNNASIFVSFLRYSTSSNGVPWFIEGHLQHHHSIGHTGIRLSMSLPL